MSFISERGFLYARNCYGLDEKIIYSMIKAEIDKLELKEQYNLKINIVRNKKNNQLGYSYLWIDNEKYFNALIGLNYDGTKRVIKTVEIIENEEQKDFDIDTDSWADLVSLEEEKVTYTEQEPLIVFPNFLITDEMRMIYRLHSNEIEFYLEQAKLILDYDKKNSLYAKDIPDWLKEQDIKNYFKVYEKDKRRHSKKGKNFFYPLVNIQNNKVSIIFSNLYTNTASFVYNMERRVVFKNTKNDEERLIKFFQNKKIY